jgi:hypothetical protein
VDCDGCGAQDLAVRVEVTLGPFPQPESEEPDVTRRWRRVELCRECARRAIQRLLEARPSAEEAACLGRILSGLVRELSIEDQRLWLARYRRADG